MTTGTLSQATPASDRWLVADPGRLWDRATVIAVVPEAPHVTTLRLLLTATPSFLPGQYYLIRLATQTPPGAVEQAYSVSSSPHPPSQGIEVTVREVEGGRVSPLLGRHMEVGDQLEVRGPYGSLTWTEKDGGPLVLIGAGTGAAPMMSILRYAAGRRLVVPMTLLSSSPNREGVLFCQSLQELARREPWLSVIHTFTRSPHDTYARYHRRVDAAMIEEAATIRGADLADTSFLVAGPVDMVGAVQKAIISLGVPDGHVYSEDHS